MSFHPTMPYGTEQHHRSMRVTLPEGPEFTYSEDHRAKFEEFAFSTGLEAWMGAVFACNAYVDAAAPWALRKTDPERMAGVLGTLAVAIRKLAQAVAPVVPASAQKLIEFIDSEAPIGQPVPIFPRLELESEGAE